MSDPARTLPAGRRRALALMLRALGVISLSALAAVAIPHAWMDRIHGAIGMGELPEMPMVSYLSRSLSLFYAWLGALALFAARDVARHLDLIRFFAASGLAVAALQTLIDLSAPLPLWWTLSEGGFLFAYFGTLRRLSRL